MSLFDEMAVSATDLMNDDDFKSPATLTRMVGGGYDRASDKYIDGSTTVIDCLAILEPRRTVVENGLIINQTVATVTVEPKKADTLKVGSVEMTVTEVETIAPNGTAIIWKAVLA